VAPFIRKMGFNGHLTTEPILLRLACSISRSWRMPIRQSEASRKPETESGHGSV